jgi:hypothetical protein
MHRQEHRRGSALAIVVALHAAAAGCSTPTSRPEARLAPQPDEAAPSSIVLGEALIRVDGTLDAERLAREAGLADLVVLESAHVFGKVYQVRFARTGGEQADETFTRQVVQAFGRVEGILSSEPNTRAQAQYPQEGH